jgi:hypothetical protein
MPSPQSQSLPSVESRRTFLRSVAATAAIGSAGCLGGNDRETDDTERDYIVLVNGGVEERVVSILVRRAGQRVAGGRYRVPKNAAIHLERGFDWGTYEVLGKRPRDNEAFEHWQSWTWKPQSCATGEYTNDDGYWTGTVRVGETDLDFSHEECPTESIGLGGGSRRPVAGGEHRIGDVSDPPAAESE